MSNSLDNDYQKLLKQVLTRGVDKKDRTGTGTKSIFGATIRHDMSDGFPILTTKKVGWKTMVTELKWFLKGDTNIKYLVDNGCNIWNGDAYKNWKTEYKETYNGLNDWQKEQWKELTEEEFINAIKTDDKFAAKWGYLGRIYGAQWREWIGFKQFDNHAETVYVDQLENLIVGLINDPNGRRHIVNSWNASELEQMTLPPCHYSFQCYVADGKLSLMWNQRSVDTFLGLPFNIASYGLLLLLLCKETGYKPGELIGNLGDVHLYSNHLEQAKEQITRDPFELPTIKLSNVDILNGEFDYEILDYHSHDKISAPISN